MPAPKPAYLDPNLPAEARASDLLPRLTLREKLGQLNQVRADALSAEDVRAKARQGLVGSRILASSAWAGNEAQHVTSIEEGNSVQRIAVEESRLGVPILNGRDIIHGHRTIFPIPIAQAASFDAETIEEAARHAAFEASAYGVHWTFAPMLDVARDPRWGRVVEGGGEDPYLTGVMGAAMVRGFQGKDPSEPGRILACAKHYLGYGTSEGGRDYASGEASDHTLRNVYLEPFRAALRAGCATVMSAFHDVNGEPISGSRYLLTDVLKHELGFSGFVVSDWASVTELVAHGVAEDDAEAASKALMAGVDMEMVTGAYLAHLEAELARGRVNLERIDDAVRRVLLAKFKKGLFERPYVDAERAADALLRPEARACARKLAQHSLVLLKNEGQILPLKSANLTIAVLGPLACARAELLGSWVLDGVAEDVTSVREALREAAPGVRFTDSPPLLDAALVAAQRADVVVLVLGESPVRTGEAHNIAGLALPPDQEIWLEALARLRVPIVAVVAAGRPLPITRVVERAAAVIYAWHPGTEGGRAIADVLLGHAAPSGKLPATLPRSAGQVPLYYAHKNGGRSINRYYPFAALNHPGARPYQDELGSPLFPFGFGLSYTAFQYSNLKLDRAEIGREESLSLSVELTNRGDRAGTEVVQCYVRDFVGSVTRPLRELKAFRRVTLNPGASSELRFELGPEELAFWNNARERKVEAGRFAVYVGGSSYAELAAEFHVR